MNQLLHGDCIEVMRTLPDNSVDSVVTDPPYNLSFMNKPWDAYNGHEDAGFCYWLAGLIDGEGHFGIKAHTRGTHAPFFALKLRSDERGTLERIKRTVGVGTVTIETRDGANDMARWNVQDQEGCQRLVDLLDKYQLRAKKAQDYWTWRAAVCEWTGRPRGNRWSGASDNTRMAALRDQLMSGRAYTEVPWSGHEFQDWSRLWAEECLRVLKPGGHLLAFGGTRTWHRLAVAVEDAGFEIRDSIAWLYGSGFPKSMDVSKAIDKMRVEDIEPIRVVCRSIRAAMEAQGLKSRDLVHHFGDCHPRLIDHWAARDTDSQPSMPTMDQYAVLKEVLGLSDDLDAEVWRLNGRKGAPGEKWEAREVTGEADVWTDRTNYAITSRDGIMRDRPVAGSPAQQWEGWGTALKPAFEPVVVGRKPFPGTVAANVLAHGTGALNIDGCRIGEGSGKPAPEYVPNHGNAVFGKGMGMGGGAWDDSKGRWPANVMLDERTAEGLGTSAAYFYVAKAPKRERPVVDGVAHATVKPLELMRQLVRLVTPPGGVVLEPFAGSGTTVEAAMLEGFRYIAIEREAEYLPLIQARIDRATTALMEELL